MQVHEIMIPLLNDIGITRDVFNDVWINWGEKAYWLLDENTTVKNLNLGKSTTDINVQDILSNKVLEGVISNAISLNNVGNIESESLKNRITEILELIRTEIN